MASIIVLYEADDLPPEIRAQYGPNRIAADVIDFDRDDAFLLWRRSDGDKEVDQVVVTGIWQNITREQAKQARDAALNELAGLADESPDDGS